MRIDPTTRPRLVTKFALRLWRLIQSRRQVKANSIQSCGQRLVFILKPWIGFTNIVQRAQIRGPRARHIFQLSKTRPQGFGDGGDIQRMPPQQMNRLRFRPQQTVRFPSGLLLVKLRQLSDFSLHVLT
jgi:hypothetical protein